MDFPSKLISDAVNEFVKFPGIGKKSALRMVLHLVKQKKTDVEGFSAVLSKLASEICYCNICFSISDSETCHICSGSGRDHSTVCVVEDIKDVMAIENTNHYKGTYHVLNGLISPMDGVGPDDLTIDHLVKRVLEKKVNELIFALSATMEGDTTMFYISRQIQDKNLQITTLSRGISVGGELEYADEVTLGRSIVTRIPYRV
jgi:recombination protein RecR